MPSSGIRQRYRTATCDVRSLDVTFHLLAPYQLQLLFTVEYQQESSFTACSVMKIVGSDTIAADCKESYRTVTEKTNNGIGRHSKWAEFYSFSSVTRKQ
jgi:hypothetical protein